MSNPHRPLGTITTMRTRELALNDICVKELMLSVVGDDDYEYCFALSLEHPNQLRLEYGGPTTNFEPVEGSSSRYTTLKGTGFPLVLVKGGFYLDPDELMTTFDKENNTSTYTWKALRYTIEHSCTPSQDFTGMENNAGGGKHSEPKTSIFGE